MTIALDELKKDIDDVAAELRTLQADGGAANEDALARAAADRLDAIVADLRDRIARADRTQDELAASLRDADQLRRQWREVVDAAPGGYMVTDASGIILEINQTGAHLLGARREFLCGRPFGMCLAQQDWGRYYGLLVGMGRRGDMRGHEPLIFR